MRTFRVKLYVAARACFSVHSGIHSILIIARAPGLRGILATTMCFNGNRLLHEPTRAITCMYINDTGAYVVWGRGLLESER